MLDSKGRVVGIISALTDVSELVKDGSHFACGIGLYDKKGNLTGQAKEQIQQALAGSQTSSYTGLTQALREALESYPGQLASLLDKEDIYILMPKSDIHNNSPPPFSFYDSDDKFITSFTQDSRIYLPFGLVVLLVKTQEEQLLKDIIDFERKNIREGFEDPEEARFLAKRVLAAIYSESKAEVTFLDLVNEGYRIELLEETNKDRDDSFYLNLGAKRINVKLSLRGDQSIHPGKISFLVVESLRIIFVENFYPCFPREKKGRGRALLRHLLDRPEYSGYRVLAWASPGLRKSFSRMIDFQPVVVDSDDSEACDRIGKKLATELSQPYNQIQFMSNPALYEKLQEIFFSGFNIYGVVP